MYLANEITDAITTILNAGGVEAKTFERDTTAKEFLKVAELSPVALLQFNHSQESKFKSNILRGKVFYFHLYIKAKNLRSPSAALTGDINSTGIYQVMESARTLLNGNRLGLNIQPLELILEKSFLKSGEQTIYLQEYKTTVYE